MAVSLAAPSMGMIGSAASGVMSSISGYYGEKAQKYQAQTNAKIIKMQGKATALNLTDQFNRSRASDVVIAAAQGRRGGSVEGMARAAEAQYNWDLDFAEMSSKIQEIGFTSQAKQYGVGATQSLLGGAIGSIGGAAMDYYDTMGKIGGSTKPKDTGFTTHKGGATWGN